MITRLDLFKEHFRAYSEQFVLIGGAACEQVMDTAGLGFRVTKDLDIVLLLEALNAEFVRVFWDFVRAGKYQIQQHSSGRRQFYRFQKPGTSGYPFMLELFAREPDVMHLAEGSTLTPLPMEEEISSLSAILLDSEYYEFIRAGHRIVNGLPLIGPETIIPLKARAWLDLTARKASGQLIDSTSIKKHKNDVLRLYQIVSPIAERLPGVIEQDLRAFLKGMEAEAIDLKALRIQGTKEEILAGLAAVYHI